ncbi:MAG: LemA family protein [Bacteroidales bacterium]|nr:MAG: LemA family protein [Bacteroidales bacterium]
MKKSWIILIVVLLLALIIYSSVKRTYNRMVLLSENVTKQWANVENVYQRRLDLIPNLVSTVKGYADFEKETLTQVIEARSKATSTTIDPNNLTAENLQQFQAMQGALSSALSRLLVVVERYPELKANQNFLELQAQLEGAENRISVERRKFNETAQAYNTYIKMFPKNIYASIFNFEEKAYFTADEEASEAPVVEF